MQATKEWMREHPMGYELVIPGTLPTLNQYTSVNRANRFAANKLKQEAEEQILAAIGENPPMFGQAVTIEFHWIRPDMRSDKDNVAFAKKFVLDALQKAHVIRSDRWKLCTPYDRSFSVNRENPRTIVRISYGEEQPC